ncbi:MAG: hypothetical protein JOZ93_12945 [Sinobacteraceae bacterium]|nr:hypothetical protein [Nevskiaceae bacterium]
MLFPTTIVGSYPQPDWLIDMSDMQVEQRRQYSHGAARSAVCCSRAHRRLGRLRDEVPAP